MPLPLQCGCVLTVDHAALAPRSLIESIVRAPCVSTAKAAEFSPYLSLIMRDARMHGGNMHMQADTHMHESKLWGDAPVQLSFGHTESQRDDAPAVHGTINSRIHAWLI